MFARAPTVEFACTNPGPNTTQDDCVKKHGAKGGPAAEAVIADLAATPGVKLAVGWGPVILGLRGIGI